jgi:hypothetical protein
MGQKTLAIENQTLFHEFRAWNRITVQVLFVARTL